MGEISTRCSHSIATRRSHLLVETACQRFSLNRVGRRVATALVYLHGARYFQSAAFLFLNLQKPTAAKALQMRLLSAFAFETITLWNFEKKMYEANASVKRNTVDTIE